MIRFGDLNHGALFEVCLHDKLITYVLCEKVSSKVAAETSTGNCFPIDPDTLVFEPEIE